MKKIKYFMITGMLLASIGLAGCGKKSEDDITNKEIYQDDLEPLTEDELNEMDADTIMLAVLNLIDVVMIANLLVMVTLGGYEIFVSKLRTKNHPDQPEWMSHVNATVLKVKLSMSIISISSIHLLQTFVNASKISEKTIMWEVIIHFSFLISAIAMAYTDKILYSTSHKNH